MTPIPLGILAASGLGGGSAYELISTTILSGTSNELIINSIPQTYKHLELRSVARTTASVGQAEMTLRLNNNSSIIYSYHYLSGGASGAVATSSDIRFGLIPGTFGNSSNIFAPSVMQILDYTSTSKNKTTRTFFGNTGSPDNISLFSGFSRSTSAISSLRIWVGVGNFGSGTRFSLYGVK